MMSPPPPDPAGVTAIHVSLSKLIEFCMVELGMSRTEAEAKARREAKAAGITLIEDTSNHA